ncbi:unnamed protein product [Mytilus coruscus]|uniref:Uncharacterized protein n=1 Tax=Mytilus coruscus TaxID=42192 RepID=A0A6J8BE89_MYTCO|nr:unnamed protein product [Mytilus coruscus]
MFEVTNKWMRDSGIDLSRNDVSGGTALYCWDIEANFSEGQYLNLVNRDLLINKFRATYHFTMNADQLVCAIKCDNEMRMKICGVFASNEISYIQLQPSTGFIANTDIKQLPGKHWVAFYYNENKVLEIFDSFGYTLSQLSVYFNEFRYTQNAIAK